MFLRLLLLFTLVPLTELLLLVELGRRMGPLPTVALVLITGALGAWLARRQGLRVLSEIRREQTAGRLPAAALVDGLLVLVAGAVLLTPGLLTDLFGFALLIPQVRAAVRQRLRAAFGRRIQIIRPTGNVDLGEAEIVIDDAIEK
nr:UPF0716 protein YtzA-like [Nerophis lumbriciformis]